MKPFLEDFRGSWAGLPVAWTATDEFDEAVFRADVSRCCRLGVPGVYTGGTTGEFYGMEFGEFERVVRATVEEAHAARCPAMIGVSATFTRGAARRAARAAELGADAIQVALPFWLEVPDAAVTGFFRDVSAAAGHIPLSIYETKRSKKSLTVDQHREIKEALPNYQMVKAGAGTVATTVEGCAAIAALGVRVFADEAARWSPLGIHGLAGCCSAFVYYLPEIVLPLNEDLKRKDWPAVAEKTAKLARVHQFLVQSFASRRLYDSAIDRIGGVAGGVLRTSLACRKPYPHGTEDDVRALRECYRAELPEVVAGMEARLSSD